MTTYREIYNQQLQIMESKMDAQLRYFRELEKIEKRDGHIPEKYQNDVRAVAAYEDYKKNGIWRDQPKVVLMVRNAATKSAKHTWKKVKKQLT